MTIYTKEKKAVETVLFLKTDTMQTDSKHIFYLEETYEQSEFNFINRPL